MPSDCITSDSQIWGSVSILTCLCLVSDSRFLILGVSADFAPTSFPLSFQSVSCSAERRVETVIILRSWTTPGTNLEPRYSLCSPPSRSFRQPVPSHIPPSPGDSVSFFTFRFRGTPGGSLRVWWSWVWVIFIVHLCCQSSCSGAISQSELSFQGCLCLLSRLRRSVDNFILYLRFMS